MKQRSSPYVRQRERLSWWISLQTSSIRYWSHHVRPL